MIASIKKCSTYNIIVEYHFKKIESGKATLIFSGVFSEFDNGKSICQTLDEHFLFNQKDNLKYKAYHFSLTLPEKENISNEKFKTIGEKYLEKMGFKNCPFFIVRHFDKKNEHIHILTSTVNFEGKTVEQFNDFFKSQKISREL